MVLSNTCRPVKYNEFPRERTNVVSDQFLVCGPEQPPIMLLYLFHLEIVAYSPRRLSPLLSFQPWTSPCYQTLKQRWKGMTSNHIVLIWNLSCSSTVGIHQHRNIASFRTFSQFKEPLQSAHRPSNMQKEKPKGHQSKKPKTKKPRRRPTAKKQRRKAPANVPEHTNSFSITEWVRNKPHAQWPCERE